MPLVKLKISTSNNTTYPKIILRKFFNMVFISEDGKKLSIYTATVFGGTIDDKEQNEIPISSYSKDNGGMRCSLDFRYDGDIICKKEMKFSDKTESLWEQVACMNQVWGACDKIETQDDVKELFQKVYAGHSCARSLDMGKKGPIYYIHESNKKSHECIVARGEFQLLPNSECGYKILSDCDMECSGMEFMNWVKTEINLSVSVLNKHTYFEIEFEKGEQYYTPDFTWYFAPPSGYKVDEESATVRIDEESKRNLVQSVAEDTTVHFKEWENEEEIDDRRKARVYISPQTNKDPCLLGKSNGIKVGVRIDNPRQMENKQFLLGLLVGFMLSFCSDKTRINDYYLYVKEICDCVSGCKCEQINNLLSIIFPFLAVTTYLSMILEIKKCVFARKVKLRKFFKGVKFLSAVTTLLVLIYVFFAWLILPGMMKALIPSCVINNGIILGLSSIGIVCNIVYIVYCMVWRKKKIYDYL